MGGAPPYERNRRTRYRVGRRGNRQGDRRHPPAVLPPARERCPPRCPKDRWPLVHQPQVAASPVRRGGSMIEAEVDDDTRETIYHGQLRIGAVASDRERGFAAY